MSKRALPFPDALALARALVHDLAPVVARCKVVGSLRRKRRTVGDIEILAEPRSVTVDLFGSEEPDIESIHRLARDWGHVTKAGMRQIQVQHVLGSDAQLDLFLVHPPADWWVLLAIRTGPAELGREAVTRMRQHEPPSALTARAATAPAPPRTQAGPCPLGPEPRSRRKIRESRHRREAKNI